MYERLATVFEPVHDELVERLAIKPGERWLDVGDRHGRDRAPRRRAGPTSPRSTAPRR